MKPNGIFIVTTFDGEKIFNAMQNKNEIIGNYIERTRDGKVENEIWKITKQTNYKKHEKKLKDIEGVKQLPDTRDSLGFDIKVSWESFEDIEYLVHPTYLINKARQFGLEIISKEEFNKLFNTDIFENGTDSFENTYSHVLRYGSEYFSNYKERSNILKLKKVSVLKEFSSFYRYFIFVNRADYNTNVYI